MAIDRDAIKKQLKTQKERRAAGSVEYIKKDSTRNLRILEFTDPDGRQQFARTIGFWRTKADSKNAILDRQTTLGAPCACHRLQELCNEKSEEDPFARRQTVYYINAIDIDEKNPQVKIFQIPSTVWEQIAEMVVSDEWADVLEAEEGHPFAISRTGEGLNTEYGCVVSRKPYPVNDKLLAQVKDPLEAVEDPGVEGQCEDLGVDLGDLWDDPDSLDNLAPITHDAPAKKSGGSKKTTKKSSKKTASKKKDPSFAVGDDVDVLYEDAWYAAEITAIDGDDYTVVCRADDSELEVTVAELRTAEDSTEEAAPEPEPEPEKPKLKKGMHGQGVYPDDGEKYPCEIKSVRGEKVTVIWADGSPDSTIAASDFEEDDIPFESGSTSDDEDEIPVPRRSSSKAKSSAANMA